MIRSTVSVSHAAGGTRAVHLSDFNACFLPSSPCALTSSTVGHGVLMVTSLGLERRPVLSTAQSRNLHTQMHKDTQTQTQTHTRAHTHGHLLLLHYINFYSSWKSEPGFNGTFQSNHIIEWMSPPSGPIAACIGLQ